MKQYAVIFAPEAKEQLAEIYRYIAAHATPEIAERYTTAIVDHCAEMTCLPYRGTQRDDIRPGLRITNYKGSATVAFAVDEAENKVIIVGIFYRGRHYESELRRPAKKSL